MFVFTALKTETWTVYKRYVRFIICTFLLLFLTILYSLAFAAHSLARKLLLCKLLLSLDRKDSPAGIKLRGCYAAKVKHPM